MFSRPVSLLIALMVLATGSTITVAKSNINNQSQLSSAPDQFLAQNPQIQQINRRGRRDKTWLGGSRIIEQLNLSQDQQQRMAAIRQRYQSQLQPIQEQVQTVRTEMRSMMSGTATNDEIRAKHQEMRQLRQEIGNLRFESLLEMREVLTPEQRNQFGELMENRYQGYRQRRGNFLDNN